jgi:hypothetical protein
MSNPKRIIDFCERESELDCSTSLSINLTEAIACARTLWLQDWLSIHLPAIVALTDTPEDQGKRILKLLTKFRLCDLSRAVSLRECCGIALFVRFSLTP